MPLECLRLQWHFIYSKSLFPAKVLRGLCNLILLNSYMAIDFFVIEFCLLFMKGSLILFVPTIDKFYEEVSSGTFHVQMTFSQLLFYNFELDVILLITSSNFSSNGRSSPYKTRMNVRLWVKDQLVRVLFANSTISTFHLLILFFVGHI